MLSLSYGYFVGQFVCFLGCLFLKVETISSFVFFFKSNRVLPGITGYYSSGDTFAGFGIHALNFGGLFLNNKNNPYNPSGIAPRLIVETADVTEPVPEPTTIFGSALALGVGGWLKQKKLNQQSKKTSQH